MGRTDRVAMCVLLLLAQLATGCSASINPQLKRSVDGQLAAVAGSGQQYGPPTEAHAPPLQVDTWATYKLLDKEGQPSLLTYKVLRKEADAYWIETVIESYYSRTVQLMRVHFGAQQSPEDIQVDRLYQKIDDGDVQEFPSQLLWMMKPLYQPMLAHFSLQWTDLPQEDVTVPAGVFQRAYKKRVTSKLAGLSDTSNVWYHDAAPVGGMVRSRSLEHGSSMELLSMGEQPQSEIALP